MKNNSTLFLLFFSLFLLLVGCEPVPVGEEKSSTKSSMVLTPEEAKIKIAEYKQIMQPPGQSFAEYLKNNPAQLEKKKFIAKGRLDWSNIEKYVVEPPTMIAVNGSVRSIRSSLKKQDEIFGFLTNSHMSEDAFREKMEYFKSVFPSEKNAGGNSMADPPYYIKHIQPVSDREMQIVQDRLYSAITQFSLSNLQANLDYYAADVTRIESKYKTIRTEKRFTHQGDNAKELLSWLRSNFRPFYKELKEYCDLVLTKTDPNAKIQAWNEFYDGSYGKKIRNFISRNQEEVGTCDTSGWFSVATANDESILAEFKIREWHLYATVINSSLVEFSSIEKEKSSQSAEKKAPQDYEVIVREKLVFGGMTMETKEPTSDGNIFSEKLPEIHYLKLRVGETGKKLIARVPEEAHRVAEVGEKLPPLFYDSLVIVDRVSKPGRPKQFKFAD